MSLEIYCWFPTASSTYYEILVPVSIDFHCLAFGRWIGAIAPGNTSSAGHVCLYEFSKASLSSQVPSASFLVMLSVNDQVRLTLYIMALVPLQ